MPSIISATTTNGVAVQGDNSGSLQLQTNNGTTAVTIDTSQNVGIGTSSPSEKLHVAGSVASSGVFIPLNSTTAIGYIGNSNPITGGSATNVGLRAESAMLFATGGATERMRITSGGDVGIGNTSPSFTAGGGLMVQNGTQANLRLDRFGEGGFEIQTVASTLRFYSTAASAERMRINASGEFLYNCTGRTNDAPNVAGGRINETNGNEKVRVAADTQVAFQFYSPSGGTASPVGTITANASSVSYNTSSDYRLKENIAPMTGALATVTQLKPVTYTWKNTGKAGQGFIAHELQAVVPDAVTGEKDAVETYTDEEGNEQTRPVYQGVDTSFLVATLTAAIQELKAELDATKAEVQALKGVA